MKKEKTFAYSEALAFESIGDVGIYDTTKNVHNNVTAKDLERYAKTIAYKVAYNLKNGFEMDKKNNPLDV